MVLDRREDFLYAVEVLERRVHEYCVNEQKDFETVRTYFRRAYESSATLPTSTRMKTLKYNVFRTLNITESDLPMPRT